jgi:hypothetical protein
MDDFFYQQQRYKSLIVKFRPKLPPLPKHDSTLIQSARPSVIRDNK